MGHQTKRAEASSHDTSRQSGKGDSGARRVSRGDPRTASVDRDADAKARLSGGTGAGYDPYSGLLYLQPKCLQGHSIPENPNREDVEEARDLLLDMVADFPFRSDAHRSAYLAWLLTCFARFAYIGNTPFFLINANSPRTGKTLLSEITSHIVVGRDFTKMSQHVDEEAERKVITSLADVWVSVRADRQHQQTLWKWRA